MRGNEPLSAWYILNEMRDRLRGIDEVILDSHDRAICFNSIEPHHKSEEKTGRPFFRIGLTKVSPKEWPIPMQAPVLLDLSLMRLAERKKRAEQIGDNILFSEQPDEAL